jgi:hypothetical protein
MAAAAHVTVNVYGQVFGKPPYQGDEPFANFVQWNTPVPTSVPTVGTIFHTVTPGQRVGNTSNYIYSVIEVLPTGLNVDGVKYASNQSVATLATGADA